MTECVDVCEGESSLRAKCTGWAEPMLTSVQAAHTQSAPGAKPAAVVVLTTAALATRTAAKWHQPLVSWALVALQCVRYVGRSD